MEIGSLAEFLSASGSLGALVAAAIAARSALRANRQQSAQLRELEENSERQRRTDRTFQASRVAAWAWVYRGQLSFRYVNSGGLPVWDFTAWVATPEKLVSETRFILQPTNEIRWLDEVAKKIQKDFGNPTPDFWIERLDSRNLLVAIVFRDALNQWWMRDFTSRLQEMKSSKMAADRIREDFAALYPSAGPTPP